MIITSRSSQSPSSRNSRGHAFALAWGLLLGLMACAETSNPTPPAPAMGQTAPEPVTETLSAPVAQAAPAAPSPAAPWVDVPAIIGLDQGAVDARLGAPTGCESVSPSRVGKSPKCSYRDGNVEIVFIKGKADWITVYGTDSRALATALDVSFDATTLAQLGLSGTPTASSPIGVFWKGSVPGVQEVTMFGKQGGKASYFYVKAFTD